MTTHEQLIKALSAKNPSMEALGTAIGKLYTDLGFPIDMALDRVDASKEDKIVILFAAQNWLMEHKRSSGATDKAIKRQRKANLDSMERFIATGEAGVY